MRGTLSLHAIANDTRSSSLYMHQSPEVSGERHGLVKESKNETASSGQLLNAWALTFRTTNTSGGRPLWTTSGVIVASGTRHRTRTVSNDFGAAAAKQNTSVHECKRLGPCLPVWPVTVTSAPSEKTSRRPKNITVTEVGEAYGITQKDATILNKNSSSVASTALHLPVMPAANLTQCHCETVNSILHT